MNHQNSKVELSEIIIETRKDLRIEKELTPLNILKDEIEASMRSNSKSKVIFSENDIKNFRKSLDHDHDVAVICEFKTSSPSMGNISNSSLEDALKVFEQSGTSAISIITEKKYFKGSMDNLRSACNITKLPIIRKDFIIHEYQIYQAKLAGASCVLLISGIYPDLEEGIFICRELGIDALVECRNREDIISALKAGADILGINNRNFQNFRVDLKTTEKLAGYVPPEVILVSESGVHDADDALKLSKYGVDALLVGTSIMGASGKNGMLNTASSIIKTLKGARVVRNAS
jgi:indole-3-glycerol phosphate synthase